MLVAVHDESTKVVKSLWSKNLGEEVSIVLGGLDIDRLHNVLARHEGIGPILDGSRYA